MIFPTNILLKYKYKNTCIDVYKKFFSQYVPRERESTGRLGDSLMAWKGREETAGEAT